MNILFASDMSFNYFLKFPGNDAVMQTMGETRKIFSAADFSVVNLENIFGEESCFEPIVKSGPNLISSDEFISYIDVLNPTAVGMANNHCGDYGAGAIRHTVKLLKERQYRVFGAGENIEEAYKPTIFEKDGIKVSVTAVCENEFGIAAENSPGAAGYSLAKVAKNISSSREQGMIPVIYFHGGNERNPFPSPGKVELYRHFIDMGAKAVIAMHTHCPQGFETYRGCPIIYSMGNFFFPKPPEAAVLPSWNYGYMTMLNITQEDISFDILPYHFDMNSHTMLKNAEKEDFLKYMSVLNAPIADENRLKSLFDGWCVISGLDGYIKSVNYSDETEKGGAEAVVHIKNIFSCEAHNELIKNSLNILYGGRRGDAEAQIETITRLQNMEI